MNFGITSSSCLSIDINPGCVSSLLALEAQKGKRDRVSASAYKL